MVLAEKSKKLSELKAGIATSRLEETFALVKIAELPTPPPDKEVSEERYPKAETLLPVSIHSLKPDASGQVTGFAGSYCSISRPVSSGCL